jgi:hypothetical protein
MNKPVRFCISFMIAFLRIGALFYFVGLSSQAIASDKSSLKWSLREVQARKSGPTNHPLAQPPPYPWQEAGLL